MAVDRNREGNTELGDENLQGIPSHDCVVLEDGVKPDDGYVREKPLYSLGLWQAAVDAAGTEHLERLDQHDLATHRRKRGRRTDPAVDLQLGGDISR